MTRSASTPRTLSCAAMLACAIFSIACGGGGSHNSSSTTPTPVTSGSNVQPIVVNAGPANNYANGVFTSVSVCVPSTSTCQTIDGVLVDTGSFGLRLLSSAGGGALTLALPQQNGPSGNPVGECAPFVSGFTWGPVQTADVNLAGEHAGNVPVQIVDPTFAAVPAGCTSAGLPEDDTLQKLGANGILGVGPFAEDCGGACAQSGSTNPGLYYECAATSCTVTTESLTQQVQNPVALFAVDNNGVIIQLPSVSGSVASLNGSMVFGIATQSNNGMGSAAVFPLNGNGEITTTFNSQSYPAFLDSGSNAIFFLDANTTGIPVCSDNSGFYCPASPANLSAVLLSGTTKNTVNFTVSNADMLFSNRTAFVFSSLAGPNSGTFDWGLPFFFGRNVFTAIQARSTPAGMGPFWAY